MTESLYISLSAVEKHIASIFAKLTLSVEDGAQHRRVAAVPIHPQPGSSRSPESRG